MEQPIETKQCIKCKVYTPIYLLDIEGVCEDCKPITQEENLKEESQQNII